MVGTTVDGFIVEVWRREGRKEDAVRGELVENELRLFLPPSRPTLDDHFPLLTNMSSTSSSSAQTSFFTEGYQNLHQLLLYHLSEPDSLHPVLPLLQVSRYWRSFARDYLLEPYIKTKVKVGGEWDPEIRYPCPELTEGAFVKVSVDRWGREEIHGASSSSPFLVVSSVLSPPCSSTSLLTIPTMEPIWTTIRDTTSRKQVVTVPASSFSCELSLPQPFPPSPRPSSADPSALPLPFSLPQPILRPHHQHLHLRPRNRTERVSRDQPLHGFRLLNPRRRRHASSSNRDRSLVRSRSLDLVRSRTISQERTMGKRSRDR